MWNVELWFLILFQREFSAINSDGRLMKSLQGSKDATPATFKVIQQTQTSEY